MDFIMARLQDVIEYENIPLEKLRNNAGKTAI